MQKSINNLLNSGILKWEPMKSYQYGSMVEFLNKVYVCISNPIVTGNVTKLIIPYIDSVKFRESLEKELYDLYNVEVESDNSYKIWQLLHL